MTNRIQGNHSIGVPRAVQNKRNEIKTDRRFQAFVDEALKSREKVQETNQSPIQISNHAQKRMEQREIELEVEDMEEIEEAFSTLKNKGAENSLIIYKDLSLIASIKNNTIITASKTDEMNEVTNIDSAIYIN